MNSSKLLESLLNVDCFGLVFSSDWLHAGSLQVRASAGEGYPVYLSVISWNSLPKLAVVVRRPAGVLKKMFQRFLILFSLCEFIVLNILNIS